MPNYSFSGGLYRENSGSWWSALSGGRLPAGQDGSGNKFESRYTPDANIKATAVTNNVVSAYVNVSRGDTYAAHTLSFGYTNSSYGWLNSQKINLAKSNSTQTFDVTALINAYIADGGASFFGWKHPSDGGSANTYTEINGLTLTINWTPKAPNLVQPGAISGFGTSTGDTQNIAWGAGSDSNGSGAALYYHVYVTKDGGVSWVDCGTTSGLGATIDVWDKLSTKNGYDQNYGSCAFGVKTCADYLGTTYESAMTTSTLFSLDWRFSANTPGVAAIANTNADAFNWNYDGGSIKNGASVTSLTTYVDLWDGGSWIALSAAAIAATYASVGVRALKGIAVGRYYYNTGMKCRIRRDVVSHGITYTGATVESNFFAVDYRVAPSNMTIVSTKYVGSNVSSIYETLQLDIALGTATVGNPLDSAGAANKFSYVVKAGGVVISQQNNVPYGTAPNHVLWTVPATGFTSGADTRQDLSAYVVDNDGQVSNVATKVFTVLRWQKPSVIVGSIARLNGKATVTVTVSDTGLGTKSYADITKVEFSINNGTSWSDATLLGSWSGTTTFSRAFDVTIASNDTRYPQFAVRVTTSKTGGPGVKVSDPYTTVILEYTPVSWAWYDTGIGYGGHAARSLIVGSDFTGVNPGAGWGYFENGIKVGANTVYHTGNLPSLNFLPLAGGNLTGQLGLYGVGTNYLTMGPGDNATWAAHNVKMHLHWGLGIAGPDDVTRIMFDARAGSISTKGSLNTDGYVTASRFAAGWDAGIANSISCSNWFRSNGATGWFNATYNGGLFMDDTGWIKTYGNKGFSIEDLTPILRFWYTPEPGSYYSNIRLMADYLGNTKMRFNVRGYPQNAETTCLELFADGHASVNSLTTWGTLELNPPGASGWGGIIDFHFNQSGADNTARIIEDQSGRIVLATNVYVNNNLSALSFTDRTKGYTGKDALSELMLVRNDQNGDIDHSTLPKQARFKHTIKVDKHTGKTTMKKSFTEDDLMEIEEEGRDLGMMISMLTAAVQQLKTQIDEVKGGKSK